MPIMAVDPDAPDQNIIQNAARCLEQDGLVIFPAACMYGVAANAFSEKAIEKVYEIKHRPRDMALSVLISSKNDLKKLTDHTPDQAVKLMNAFWPGRLTLVFRAGQRVSSLLCGRTGKIAVRLPAHPVAKALVDAVDFPITATSANLSGHPGAISAADLDPGLVRQSHFVLDAGRLMGGAGSTVADITRTPVHIIREGLVSSRDIFNVLEGCF